MANCADEAAYNTISVGSGGDADDDRDVEMASRADEALYNARFGDSDVDAEGDIEIANCVEADEHNARSDELHGGGSGGDANAKKSCLVASNGEEKGETQERRVDLPVC